MIWLYWNRCRPAVLAIGLTLTSVVALVAVAGSLAGGAAPRAPKRAAAGRTGAQFRRSAQPAVNAASVRQGRLLLADAAVACEAVSYRGVQMVAWWGPAGSSAYLIHVWHRRGELALARGDDDAGQPSGSDQLPGAAGVHDADGVLSVTAWMLSLMRANYQIEYAGTGSASNRPAQIVELRRMDGTLAARFWLDVATSLPLRREMFDPAGHLVNEGAFIDLQIGDREIGKVPAAGAQPWTAPESSRDLASLRKRGWQVPVSLDGDMTLVAVTRTSTTSGFVIDAAYSDGLSVVSVFIQRGELARSLPGWRLAAISGQAVYAGQPDERSVAWSAGGFVYTVIADAPPETVGRIVAELPHDRHLGFWQRVGRGLKRMGSWLDPFG